MHPEQERPARPPADEVRRQVVEAVSNARLSPAQPAAQAELNVYLTLLQDCLPVYVGATADLLAHAGRATVRENLALTARATIDFYGAVFTAKTSVLASPAQLVLLRQVMRSRRLGPHQADEAIADYLRRERDLGRVGADVDVLAAARLLTGGCLGYVYNRTLMGSEALPSRDEYARALAHGLRLGP
jgi:hypothetical protein